VRWDAYRKQWQALFPTPLSVVRAENGELGVLRPMAETPEGDRVDHHDLDAEVGLLDGDGDPAGGWLSVRDLETYLHGEDIDELSLSQPDELWQFERRVGLARRADRTVLDGLLYSTQHLRPAEGVGFATRCRDLPSGRPAASVRFGGESRRAEVVVCRGEDAPALPEPADRFENGRVLLYLATPALFADGWRPSLSDLGEGVELVAAAVAGPAPVATATPDHRTGRVAAGRVAWSVEAGSVYFLRCADPAQFVRDWHAQLLPQMDDPLVTAGFGLALVGSW
jgi:CRISPR-associated protein Cmr3